MQGNGTVKKIQMLVEVGGEGEIQESQMVLGIPAWEGCYVVELVKKSGEQKYI